MERKKRLGKGIEEISHYFLSSAGPLAPKPVLPEIGQPISSTNNRHRIIAITSQTPNIPSLFWSSQFAIALSSCGRKVLMVDVGTDRRQLSSVMNSMIVYPSLSDFLDQENKTITVKAPGGFQMLSFQIRLEELRQFNAGECEILFEILMSEEQAADVLLLNIDFDAMQNDLGPYLQSLHEAVLIVAPENLLGAYRSMKILFSLRPELRLGLVEYGQSHSARRDILQQLLTASKTFLQTVPIRLGSIPREVDPLAKRLGTMTSWEELQFQALLEISKRMLQGLNGQERESLFFEQIKSPFDLLNTQMEGGKP